MRNQPLRSRRRKVGRRILSLGVSMRNTLTVAAVLVAFTATSAAAQGRGRNTDGVPPGMRPPAGMCRVWITGVPPGRQAAATDCATAEAQARLTPTAVSFTEDAREGTARPFDPITIFSRVTASSLMDRGLSTAIERRRRKHHGCFDEAVQGRKQSRTGRRPTRPRNSS